MKQDREYSRHMFSATTPSFLQKSPAPFLRDKKAFLSDGFPTSL